MEKPWFKSYEEGVPKHIDIPQVLITDFLEESASKFPQNTALTFIGKKITYSQLKDLVSSFAGGLREKGIKEGSKVSIMLPNCPQFVICYYAILKLGGVVVQTNPLYVEDEIEKILSDSGAECIITLDLLYPRVSSVCARIKCKSMIITSIKDYLPFPLSLLYPLKAKPPKVNYSEHVWKFLDLLKQPKVTETIGKPENIAMLQYTGGTTGGFKGAMLTHTNLVTNTLQSISWLVDSVPGEEVILAAIPFFHVYGMTIALNLGMKLAANLVLIPKFEVKKILKSIPKHKPTIFPGVPKMYMALNDHPDVKKYNLKSISICISGSAALPVEVKKRFEELTNANLVEGYGLTEASPSTHCNPLKGQNKLGSIGLPFPNTDSKIMDIETGTKEMPVGEIGELVIKGPQVMQGYWNLEQDTKDSLRDGWLYTGDIAKTDEDGYFYIVDRKKEMILSPSGFNVYPRDIEEVLYAHPKIQEAAVVGIPTEKGEAIKAFIVLKEELSEDEIIEYCKEKLAKYKIPEFIEFKDELPKSMIGKILKKELLKEYKK